MLWCELSPGRVSPPTQSRRFKDVLYEQFARVSKALASPRRIELIELLVQSPHTVDQLTRLSGMSLANTSAHLQVLRAARLVESSKNGLFVTYRLADPLVAELLLLLRRVAETRLAEVERLNQEFHAAREPLQLSQQAGPRRRVRKRRMQGH